MTERITSRREARAAIIDGAIYGDIIAEAVEMEFSSDDGDDMTPTGRMCRWTAADMIGAEF